MSNTILWYKKPAENFDQALPIGNGRIGGMVYGNYTDELIHLNEDSVWSGGKRNRNNPDSLKNLYRRLYADVPELPPLPQQDGVPKIVQMPVDLSSYDRLLEKGGAANG